MPSLDPLYIGLMSGTSMDGVDAVLASFATDAGNGGINALASAHAPFPNALRAQLFALQAPGDNELHREAAAANELARVYASVIDILLTKASLKGDAIRAIGAHGQTVRHRPECGYTRQIGNAALLAELTGISVVADFRSRDIAAGGQGAPLVPAFHQAAFGARGHVRVVANIGGIANISVLRANEALIGFDTGPGNVLLDLWCARHRGQAYDANGDWARTGQVHPPLLQSLLAEPYLQLPPPKSTGRDLFHAAWLEEKLRPYDQLAAADIQATLTAFTAASLGRAVRDYASDAEGIYVCGGGAYNRRLLELLAQELQHQDKPLPVHTTADLGVPPDQVEAFAFAWLAHRHLEHLPGNVCSVTGARGPRILGALYPA
ncbi:MAG TPA: anhydro-N-acetylmuramic acid kinase [Noviherbaspirillum sp.]